MIVTIQLQPSLLYMNLAPKILNGHIIKHCQGGLQILNQTKSVEPISLNQVTKSSEQNTPKKFDKHFNATNVHSYQVQFQFEVSLAQLSPSLL